MWNTYTGETLLEKTGDNLSCPNEEFFEDGIKGAIAIASNQKCVLSKFQRTDGFAYYIKDSKITFILHECKVRFEETGKSFRGYSTCFRKSLLQVIGYYFKIKYYKFCNFSPELIKIAKDFNYTDVNKFVIDNFGLFIITNPEFTCTVPIDSIMYLIEELEQPIMSSLVSPSMYWKKDKQLRYIMENFNFKPSDLKNMRCDVDFADIELILNNILNK